LAFLTLLAITIAGIRLLSGGFRTYSEASNRSLYAHVPSLSSLAGPLVPETQIRNRRLVYPYSIVPGGVESAQELRDAAAHDSTVARHYAGFNYDRARVSEVKRASLVYLSYRRGNKVYWTRKQVSLHVGEKVLSDGKITARTRCGNQVSVLPQAETSPEEPLEAELDRPDGVASGIELPLGNFDSNLFNVDPGIPAGPSSPTGGTFAGSSGGAPSGFIPLPAGGPGGGGGGGGGTVNPPGGGGGGGGCVGTDCNPPTPVPEPGSAILFLSGVAAVVTRLRIRKH
jgi:hypothetical protein